MSSLKELPRLKLSTLREARDQRVAVATPRASRHYPPRSFRARDKIGAPPTTKISKKAIFYSERPDGLSFRPALLPRGGLSPAVFASESSSAAHQQKSNRAYVGAGRTIAA